MGNVIMKKTKYMDQDHGKATKYKSTATQKSMKKMADKAKKRGHETKEEPVNPNGSGPSSPKLQFGRRSCDYAMNRLRSPPLTRSMSRLQVAGAGGSRASLLRTMSQVNRDDAESSSLKRTFSRSMSRTGGPNPIMYTNLHGLVKPPANERQLECSLEDLCFGCIKKIKIARDAINENGRIVQDDETFTIKVKPGWRQGTRITFEGKGSTADLIFTIVEKVHPSFSRRDNVDDLEFKVDIPLVEALTGCTLDIPLLGGRSTSLTVDDVVISPGYERVIEGEGMPRHNEPTTRGDLIVVFSIDFPEELSDEQRSAVASILQQAF